MNARGLRSWCTVSAMKKQFSEKKMLLVNKTEEKVLTEKYKGRTEMKKKRKKKKKKGVTPIAIVCRAIMKHDG